jgi:hypothetical protein
MNKNEELKHFGVLGMHWGVKRTKPKYDKSGRDVSAHPYKRLFKDKGQSDKDFDREYDAEMRQLHKEVKAEQKAKAKRQIETVQKNRARTQELIKKDLYFKQAKYIDMRLGGNPDSSPAAVVTRNLIGQMVVAGVSIAILSKLT